jgi:hypothetical protein
MALAAGPRGSNFTSRGEFCGHSGNKIKGEFLRQFPGITPQQFYF